MPNDITKDIITRYELPYINKQIHVYLSDTPNWDDISLILN